MKNFEWFNKLVFLGEEIAQFFRSIIKLIMASNVLLEMFNRGF